MIQFQSLIISLDFELALINAFSTCLPDAEFQGCLLHLVKNNQRRLPRDNLLRLYNADAHFAMSARIIPALAFVLAEPLEKALDCLNDSLP